MKKYYIQFVISDGYDGGFWHGWVDEKKLHKIESIVEKVKESGNFADFTILDEKEVMEGEK